jgi:hypothetical protein
VVGLGWVYAMTKVPAIEAAVDAVYDLWARFRLPITGRPALVDIIEQRRKEGMYCHPTAKAGASPGCDRDGVLSGKQQND